MDSLPTINEALTWGKLQLSNGESPSIDVKVLLGFCLNQNQTYLMTWPERRLSHEQWQQYQTYITKRAKGEPVAHITGFRDFWTLTLSVNPHTLIPRPETELLVETALDLCQQKDLHVLDLGTGTGAIGLALAKENGSWKVLGCDVVDDAIALAKDNAARNSVNNIEFIQSDWFEKVPSDQFDLIVSNPPYIESSNHYLSQGDVRFEPRSALVSGDNGLADIKRITVEAERYLRNGGWLILEHGHKQGLATREILVNNGYKCVSTKQDLAGHDRITLGQR